VRIRAYPNIYGMMNILTDMCVSFYICAYPSVRYVRILLYLCVSYYNICAYPSECKICAYQCVSSKSDLSVSESQRVQHTKGFEALQLQRSFSEPPEPPATPLTAPPKGGRWAIGANRGEDGQIGEIGGNG